MATAREKPSPRSNAGRDQGRAPKPPRDRDRQVAPTPEEPAREPIVLRAADAIYRFLASLKLAVILIFTLAATLGYATFYETFHGTGAVQTDIYRSKGFALLMAMLGVNILCAALIRFPWKRRQTGFVVTHAGLLVLLAGSFLSIKTTDEGQVGIVEGESSRTFARTEAPVIRLRKLDPATGSPTREFALAINPGAFRWETDRRTVEALNPRTRQAHLAARGAAGFAAFGIAAGLAWLSFRKREFVGRLLGAVVTALGVVTCGALSWYAIQGEGGVRRDVLSEPGDPIRLAMTDFLPASSPLMPEYLPGPDGVPMIRASLLTQPPNAPRATDALGGDGWIAATDRELGRGSLNAGPAVIDFLHLDGPNASQALDAFLHPPEDPTKPTARFYYRGRDGVARVHTWTIGENARGESFELPESDLKVTYFNTINLPTGGQELVRLVDPERPLFDRSLVRLLMRLGEATGRRSIPAALFNVSEGDGPTVRHIGWSGAPMAPVSPALVPGESAKTPLLWVDYFEPPELGGGGPGSMTGTFGVIQVAESPEGEFYYRAFGRDGLKGIGPLKRGEIVKIFGGEKMPMQVSFRVDESIPSGIVRAVSKPIEVPANQMDQAIPAARLEFTVDGTTSEFWLRRTRSLEASYQPIELAPEAGRWEVSFDYDTRPLPFRVELVDFNPQNDPGSTARSSFRSDVFPMEPDAKLAPTKPFADLAVGEHFYFLDRPREALRKTTADEYRPYDDSADAVRVEDASATVQPTPEPRKIYMNHPMVRDNWSFYQAEFRSLQEPGRYMSIFAVRYDVAWPVVYVGCLLVILGTFLQFYMRAGIFTDGGKRERERVAKQYDRDASPEFDL